MSNLGVYQTLLNVSGGVNCKVGIQVSNPTNHDITEPHSFRETLIGQICYSTRSSAQGTTRTKEAGLSEGTEPESIPVNDSDLGPVHMNPGQ